MDLPDDPTDYKRLLSFMMHELRRIHEVLDQNATQLSVAVKGSRADVVQIRPLAHRVVEGIYILHNWLAIADFYLDPDQFAREPRRRINLHQLFYKAKVNLSVRSKARGVTLQLVGLGEFFTEAHPIIGIVPYLLLDNALKYAPRASKVHIALSEEGPSNVIRVSSVGPLVFPDELPHIWEAGIRGRGAQQVTVSGHGQGLALLRAICVYNDATVSASSDRSSYSLNGVDYSQFAVELRFQKA
jgi:light-regulated signal transduction histidine kinase (bacteriophytochrome)